MWGGGECQGMLGVGMSGDVGGEECQGMLGVENGRMSGRW